VLPRTCLGHDSEEMLAILEPFDPRQVGVCLDVNHANLREDVLAATRNLAPRVVTTHISDNDGDDERHWMPGKGIIPWGPWSDTLVGAGYDGPFIYEVGWQKVGEPEHTLAERFAAIRRNAEELLLGGAWGADLRSYFLAMRLRTSRPRSIVASGAV